MELVIHFISAFVGITSMNRLNLSLFYIMHDVTLMKLLIFRTSVNHTQFRNPTLNQVHTAYILKVPTSAMFPPITVN